MKITKDQVKKKVDTHFHKDVKNDSYHIESIKGSELLTFNRFDLAFKILYLEMIENKVIFSKKIYKDHIRAFSLGKFEEPGSLDKNSIDQYYQNFLKIFESIDLNDFSSDQSLVPLSIDGSIANGSHRVASAIVTNKIVDCIKLNASNHIYDYSFFYKRGVPENFLDIAATKFVEYSSNVYIAIIWPSAVGCESEINKIIKNIIYKKNVKLDFQGAHNLISQIYYGEDWIGSEKDGFSGAKHKLVECFKTYNSVRVIAFKADNFNDVINTKQKIRDIFKIGKHSIHITDNKDEAIRVSRTLFNANSIHMLNHSVPNKYLQVHKNIEYLKDFALSNKLMYEDFVVDGSMLLALYGLRKSVDIDLLCNSDSVQNMPKGIGLHDDELFHHQETKNELIYNPDFYFYFNGLKFLSFERVFFMKKNRSELKDLNDCSMMEALLERNRFKKNKATFIQFILYSRVKGRSIVISLLKFLKIYLIIKHVYLSLFSNSFHSKK